MFIYLLTDEHLQSSGAVWKSRWTSWAPVPNKPTVSVDVKQHFNDEPSKVPGKIKWREVELDLQVGPEEIMSREVELGCESWTSLASSCSSTAVRRTLSLWLCPARQLKQKLCTALVAAQWRGDTALTLPLFWRRSTVSPVFFRRYPRSSLHSFVLFPPSLISHLASVDVKQNVPHEHWRTPQREGTLNTRFHKSLGHTRQIHAETQPQGTAQLHTITASETQQGYTRSRSHKNTIRYKVA